MNRYWSPKKNGDRKFGHQGEGAATDFNHAISLPLKNGQPMPLFDYEQLLFDTLQSNKHVWIKKATGLGVTEFMLRYMAWLCFSDISVTEKSQMCIVTGPRIELAITLIDRMKGLFSSRNFSFDSKETVIELNGVHIEAYPSHHLDSMRGLKDVSFIYLDEADFFPPGEQQDARDVSERI
jgi:late competence protein required for DNA uptake (superfamily II DNA/RNA helicase)